MRNTLGKPRAHEIGITLVFDNCFMMSSPALLLKYDLSKCVTHLHATTYVIVITYHMLILFTDHYCDSTSLSSQITSFTMNRIMGTYVKWIFINDINSTEGGVVALIPRVNWTTLFLLEHVQFLREVNMYRWVAMFTLWLCFDRSKLD